jgi:hypothetical protein
MRETSATCELRVGFCARPCGGWLARARRRARPHRPRPSGATTWPASPGRPRAPPVAQEARAVAQATHAHEEREERSQRPQLLRPGVHTAARRGRARARLVAVAHAEAEVTNGEHLRCVWATTYTSVRGYPASVCISVSPLPAPQPAWRSARADAVRCHAAPRRSAPSDTCACRRRCYNACAPHAARCARLRLRVRRLVKLAARDVQVVADGLQVVLHLLQCRAAPRKRGREGPQRDATLGLRATRARMRAQIHARAAWCVAHAHAHAPSRTGRPGSARAESCRA